MTIPVVRKRAKRPKTRTGCRTCRARHIKCDEERPACLRCTRSGRICDGYEMSTATQQGSAKNKALLLPKGNSPKLIPGPASIPSSNGPFELTAVELSAYEYFKWQTAHQQPGSSWAPSWEKLAIQVGQYEPAVMHAMIAVGAMHQWSSDVFNMRTRQINCSPYRPPNTAQQGFAISHYNKSMAYMQRHIKAIAQGGTDSNVEIVLLVCLLFVCFEILQDVEASAVLHLRTGLRILYDCVSGSDNKYFQVTSDDSVGINPYHSPESDNFIITPTQRRVFLKAAPSSMIDILLHTFVQLDADLTLFGMQEPYLQPTCGSGIPASFLSIEEARLHLDVLTSSACQVRGLLLRYAERQLITENPDCQTTEDDAFYCLMYATSRTVHIPDPTVHTQMQEVRRDLASWMSALAFIPVDANNEATRAHLLIQIQFFYLWFMVSTWRDDNETLADRFEDQFAHVLGLAEQYVKLSSPDTNIFTVDPSLTTNSKEWQTDTGTHTEGKLPFSLGTGIWPCVFMVAQKCRNSSIRLRALTVLQSLSVKGFIDSFMLASFTAQIIELEENRARSIGGFAPDHQFQSHEVPESARFFDVTLAGGAAPTIGRLLHATHDDYPSNRLSIEDHFFDLQTFLTCPIMPSEIIS